MVVSGSVEKPLFGMLHRDGTPVDLCGCPLYPPPLPRIQRAANLLLPCPDSRLITWRETRRTEILLLTESQFDGGMMLRFVLRSETKLTQLRAALPWLRAQPPQLKLITANIQPVHMAIMEGDEIYLTDQQALAGRLTILPLWIRPQKFLSDQPYDRQPPIAMRRRVTLGQLPVLRHMWDAFAVGGFGLHCATPRMQLTRY